MPASAQQHLLIDNLSKGMNTYDPASRVAKGFYVDAQNMLLTNKTPITVGGLTKFNTTAAPNGETVVWFEPYTSGSTTIMLVATSGGRIYSYNNTTDTWTLLRAGLSTTATSWTHVPFRGNLLFTNGSDPVFKYDGSKVLPLGSKSITDFSDGTWTNGTSVTSPLLAGASTQQVIFSRAETITLTGVLPSTLDLLEGPTGAPDFTDSDIIQFKAYIPDTTAWNRVGSSVKDQYSATNSTWLLLGYSTTDTYVDWAFKFVPTSSYSLSSILLELQVIGTPGGTVTVEIQTNNAGVPSNTAITNGTSVAVNSADLPTTQWTQTAFRFTGAPSVTSGTTYWIVVKRSWTPSTSNHVRIHQHSGAAGNAATNTIAAPTAWTTSALATNWQAVGTDSSITLRISSNGTTDYYSSVVQQTFTEGWNTVTIPRGYFGATGSPSWSGISQVQFVLTPLKASSITLDDLITRYDDDVMPPVGSLIEMYSQQAIVGGIPDDLVAIRYSDAGTPDYFPADNVARFSGGRHALEKTDQITALKSYFDELIVGKVNSAWTFSGTGDNVSISALPLTIGIDAHRGVVETPWSLHFMFENNIFGARLTSRGLVSSNISSLLQAVDGTKLSTMASLRSDRTHTVRWTMRTTASPTQNDLGLIYDYQLDSWTSKYTPAISYYTRAIVNGNREILVSQYDGYIRRADVGTDFDGTPIVSYVTLPYFQAENQETMDNVARWIDATVYLRGTAAVNVDARFADEPHEFETATFTTYGTVQATPDGDKGYVYLGVTSRWIQMRLRATAGWFEILPPTIIGYNPTLRRI